MSTHQSSAQAGSGLSFCTATLSDAAAVRALVVSAFRGASSRAGWTTEADLFTDERVSEDGVVEKIKRADSQVVMVLDETNILLGCAEIVRHGAIVQIGMVAVSPSKQGQGVGKLLITHLEQVAIREYKAEMMELL
ncbi:hypothetical protein MY11210_004097 [Beauveria gryllotalpidicola]